MRLVIREYLGMLREEGEFDVLLPDLLLAMNIVPLSKSQKGVRQGGVDVAGIKTEATGEKTLWLFVLKRGDLGRREWDSQPQSIRQSLEEIKDIYLRNHLSAEHANLPIVIVVGTTGEFKQEIEQARVGYAETNTLPNRSYEWWNGDYVASLIEQHLLNEYALPAASRSQLRRALALIGTPGYDLEHFFALLKSLLEWENDASGSEAKRESASVRALLTILLSLGIVCRWAEQEGNLRVAVTACERTLLWTWDALQRAKLTGNKKNLEAYIRLADLYLSTTVNYFNKVSPHLTTKDALAKYHRESSLLTEVVFEEIGLIATIGLTHVLLAFARNDKDSAEAVVEVAETLNAFLDTHRCSGSPCYDRNTIEITLALLLFMFIGRTDYAKSWVRELIRRLDFAFKVNRWFPIATDSFDDLVTFAVERDEIDLKKMKETSWMIPTLAQWAAVLGEDEAYESLARLKDEELPETTCQLWYPDEHAASIGYRGPAHWESGISEAPLILPKTAEAMRLHIQKTLEESPVKVPVETSASKAGLPWLDLLACRHYKTPLSPLLWQNIGKGRDSETSGVGEATENPVDA